MEFGFEMLVWIARLINVGHSSTQARRITSILPAVFVLYVYRSRESSGFVQRPDGGEKLHMKEAYIMNNDCGKLRPVRSGWGLCSGRIVSAFRHVIRLAKVLIFPKSVFSSTFEVTFRHIIQRKWEKEHNLKIASSFASVLIFCL